MLYNKYNVNKYIASLGVDSTGFVNFSKSLSKNPDNFLITSDCLKKDKLKYVLENVMISLSDYDRKVILLLYYENLNVNEVSLVLNITVQQVYNINRSIVERFQDCINNLESID